MNMENCRKSHRNLKFSSIVANHLGITWVIGQQRRKCSRLFATVLDGRNISCSIHGGRTNIPSFDTNWFSEYTYKRVHALLFQIAHASQQISEFSENQSELSFHFKVMPFLNSKMNEHQFELFNKRKGKNQLMGRIRRHR